ncbi:MAG: hypothetical protein IKP88_03120 [Lachnospiraceae bacterium]|nr:hypothetical protein [Lachnospiraceae bacterium]
MKRLFKVLTLFLIIIFVSEGIIFESVKAASKKISTPKISVKVSQKNKSVKITINKTKGASWYVIEMCNTDTETQYTKVKKLKKDGTVKRSYTKKNLKDGTYLIRVRAFAKDDEKTVKSEYSEEITVKVGETASPTKVPITGIPLLPFDRPMDEPLNIPRDIFDRDNLPESFENEKQLSEWLADRRCTMDVTPIMEKHGFSLNGKKIVKEIELSNWTAYHYEYTYVFGKFEARIVIIISGSMYADALDGHESLLVKTLDFYKNGTVFYSYDSDDYKWPKDGLEFFLQNF